MPLPRTKPSHAPTLCAAIRHARKVLCSRLHQLGAEPDGRFAHDFATAVAEVEAGFRHEELLMGSLGYARLREQREENAVVLSALHRVLPEVEDGNVALGREVVTALLDVLSMHRLSADLALALRTDAPQRRARAAAVRAQHLPTRLRHTRQP